MKKVIEPTPFEKDWAKPLMINGKQSNRGYYNLCCLVCELSIYVHTGMKPNAHWKIGDVKKYFGIKGNKHDILKRLKEFKDGIITLDIDNKLITVKHEYK